MQCKSIITISRQYGSGGRFIGQKLAENLGIPFYDNEIITLSAEKSGYAQELFVKPDQESTTSFMYSLSLFNNVNAAYHMPLNDKIFIIQSGTIKDIAQKGACVIVGRCADYVLREMPNCISVFIHSDMEHKIKRAIEYYDLPEKKAADTIMRTNRKRETYYNYYTDKKWGKADNYHICINSDFIGIDGSVDTIAAFVDAHQKML